MTSRRDTLSAQVSNKLVRYVGRVAVRIELAQRVSYVSPHGPARHRNRLHNTVQSAITDLEDYADDLKIIIRDKSPA